MAWESIGWKPAWFSEIEKFPSAVLAHHWPDVFNHGDMTGIAAKIAAGETGSPDVLVGGTPCQAFSVAGLRNSLSDDRGQLTLEFVKLADQIDETRKAAGLDNAIIVWENVPGVLTTKDNAFGCFLGALSGEDCELQPSGKKWTNAGCVYGPKRTIAWRVLDAQYFGVAQRRRRVFVVASARKGFDPAKVLFESEGVRRDSAPGREAGKGFAGNVESGTVKSGCWWDGGQISQTLDAVLHKGQTMPEKQRFPAVLQPCMTVHGTQDPCSQSELSFALGRNNGQENAIFSSTGAGYWKPGAGTIRAREQESHEHLVAAFAENNRSELRFEAGDGSISGCLSSGGGKPGQGLPAVLNDMAVRRLTPVECERLQGFPDNHTRILWRNKAADNCPDGPRYKAIGNSMAVPVMRWIGERINDQATATTRTRNAQCALDAETPGA